METVWLFQLKSSDVRNNEIERHCSWNNFSGHGTMDFDFATRWRFIFFEKRKTRTTIKVFLYIVTAFVSQCVFQTIVATELRVLIVLLFTHLN